MLMRIRVPFPRRITICIIKISTKRVAQALDNQKAPSGKIPPEWFCFPTPFYISLLPGRIQILFFSNSLFTIVNSSSSMNKYRNFPEPNEKREERK